MEQVSNAHRAKIIAILSGILLVLICISILVGRYQQTNIFSLPQFFHDSLAQRLILELRLPRIIMAVLLGMSLSAAGAVFQMIFSNPLVEPGFLGVSQGAAFGTALCIIMFSNNPWLVQIFAIGFGLSGLFCSYLVARNLHYGGWVLRLVLAGIAVSAFFSAGLGLLKYIADPLSQLPEITFWLLGGLWSITWQRINTVIIFIVVALILLYMLRWRINLLSLNDETSYSLGISPQKERTLYLFIATVATAMVTALCGMVGWVGLIVPHIARRLVGADARYSITASILLGGIFTLACDDLARSLLSGEIPIGILTSLLGAGLFLFLLMTQRLTLAK